MGRVALAGCAGRFVQEWKSPTPPKDGGMGHPQLLKLKQKADPSAAGQEKSNMGHAYPPLADLFYKSHTSGTARE